MKPIHQIVCLLARKQNRKWVTRNAKKQNFGVDFFKCFPNGKHGFNIKDIKPRQKEFQKQVKEYLRNAKENKNVLLFDDRLQFLLNPMGMTDPPKDWDIIYFNGNIKEILETEKDSHYTKAKVTGSTAILINAKVIKKFLKDSTEFNEYILKKTFVVENNKAEGLEPPNIPNELSSVPMQHTLTPSGKSETNLKLKEMKEKDYPTVSLITPIRSVTPADRSLMFFTVMNFYKLDYPKDKLEWIIADDTPDSEKVQITDILPGNKDSRIKVIKCNVETGHRLSLGKKLNVCLTYVSSEHVVHFFEKTYYPPQSIKTRIQALVTQPEKMCVGATTMGFYNFIDKSSFESTETDPKGNPTILFEPSMAYHKKFWDLRPFHEYLLHDTIKYICILPWSLERYSLLVTVPYQYLCVGLTATEKAELKSEWNFPEMWDHKLQESLNLSVSDYLANYG